MKCVVITENLKRALLLIERNTTKNLTLPILGAVLIDAEKNFIKITGTNLETGVEVFIRGSVHGAGRVVIPVKTLSSFVATLGKDERIILESDNIDLYIHTDSQKTIFKGYQPEDFPPFPDVKHLYTFTIKKQDLTKSLSRLLTSVSKSVIKPELASVYFLIEKDMVTTTSTDGFRLSEEKIKPLATTLTDKKEVFLLPVKTAEEVLRLGEYSEDEKIEFFVGKGETIIKFSNTDLYSRLTEGSFPDYSSIIPRKCTTTMAVSKALLAGHVRRASIFTNKLNGITFTLDPEEEKCTIESNNKDVGEYHADFLTAIKGSKLTVVFNYHYFLEGVEGFSADNILLEFSGESQPLLIHPNQKEASLYIIMPMKGVV